MSNHICTDCHRTIAGPAVLRGNGHVQKAWHRDCAILAGIVEATLRQTVATELAPLRAS